MAKDYTQYKLNVYQSPVDKRDWKYETIQRDMPYTFPDVLDLRDNMLPVRDQGSQGSCAAMAGAAMKEWQEELDVDMGQYMSPQFIYNNRENWQSEGMYMRDLMRILKDLGTCREKTFPYGSTGTPTPLVFDEAKKYTIKAYAAVQTVSGLKQSLSDNGPCEIAVPVYNFGERMWYQREDDFYMGGHAMCVAGYDDKGFIIRNSWGDDWCDNGYTIFPYEDWGLQWEVWSTVDAESGDPIVPPVKKKILKYLIIGAVVAGLIFVLTKLL